MNKIDVVILCGGVGSRLKAVVSDRPKPMAEINGRPFLDILINYVLSYGFKRIIFCSGYKSGYIKKYYSAKPDKEVDFIFSEETEELGTAGAIKNTEKLIKTTDFLVMNGDSFCSANLNSFVAFHKKNNAILSMVLVEMPDSTDAGSVHMDESGKIVKFREKIKSGKSIVNAGIYLFKIGLLSQIKSAIKSSLEYDVFPKLVSMEEAYGFVTKEPMIDIGTPERYGKASLFFK